MGTQRLDHRLTLCVSAAVFALCSYSALGAAPAASTADSSASGGDALEEVVVTAERRSEDVQKTALAVTVITPDKIEKTGVSTFDTLLENVPGVQVQAPQGPGSIVPYIAIRGLGTDGDNKPGATQVYLDGVLTGSLGGELYDLNRVEVLRGPQGTLYGGSATGGAINIITNDPNFNGYSGSAQIEAGDYGLLHEIAALNAPITDTVAVRAAVNTTRRDSYADATNELNTQTNARVKLLVQPSDAASLLFGGEFFRLNGPTTDGYKQVNSDGHPVGPYYGVTGFGGYQGYRLYGDLKFNVGIGTLTNITSVEKTRNNPSNFSVPEGAGVTNEPHRDTTTEELRLSSNPDSKITWVVGLWDKYYYQHDEVDIAFGASELPIPSSAIDIRVPESNQWQQYALFSQATLPITDSTRVTGGLRFSRDEIDFIQHFTWTGNGPSFLNCDAAAPVPVLPCTVNTEYNNKANRTDWLARLEQDLSPNNMLYLMASTGYRPGGDSAPRTDISQSAATYNSEVVHAFEFGSKNRFADNRVQLNGDVYLNRYPSFQNEITNIGGPGGQAHIPSIVGIAAQFYGAELEAAWAATAADRLTWSASYVHAQFTQNGSWTNPFGGPTLALATSGGSVPHAPKFQSNIDYTHTFQLGNGGNIVGDVSAHAQSSQAIAFDPCLYSAAACLSDGSTVNGLVQKGYELLNLSGSYNAPNDKFTATLYCRNCANAQIKTFSAGGGWYTLSAPFTFGVVLGAKF